MSRRRNVLIGTLIGFGLIFAMVAVAIVLYIAEPAARPCLMPAPNAATLAELRAYAAAVPNAEALADETDAVCLLELTGEGTELTMHYYEDDDGLSDFVPYALATRHLRYLSHYRSLRGVADAGQRYAMTFAMLVHDNGKVYPVYVSNPQGWKTENHPIAYPGALVANVRYGPAQPIRIGLALGEQPPAKYRKATTPLVIGPSEATFDRVRPTALQLSGKSDSHRSGTHGSTPSTKPANPRPPATPPRNKRTR